MQLVKEFLEHKLEEMATKLKGRIFPAIRAKYKGKSEAFAETLVFLQKVIPTYDAPRFCVAQRVEQDYYFAFYDEKGNIGKLDKAVLALKFKDWDQLYTWFGLQAHMISEVNKGLQAHAKNNTKSQNEV